MPEEPRATAGASARAEYERRRDARLARHRRRFGRLGGLTARLHGESQSERNWLRGAEGEERVGRSLEKRLRDRGVIVLHDLSVPGRRTNIDHVCIGPGGVTVVDAKRHAGRVKIRRRKLWVNGRNQTRLIEGVLKQVEVVRGALANEGLTDIDIRGALCWVEDGGLPILRRLRLDDVQIGWTRRIARLARRRGDLSPEDVARIAQTLEQRLPAHRGKQPRT